MPERTRDLPVLQPFSPLDIHCGNCEAACCRRGTSIPLTDTEVHTLEMAGTVLRYDKREPASRLQTFARGVGRLLHQKVADTRAFYAFESDCGNLRENPETGQLMCAIYEDPERPAVCEAFKQGTYQCMVVRTSAGVNTEEQLALFDQMTRS